jgi:hypothetical protein
MTFDRKRTILVAVIFGIGTALGVYLMHAHVDAAFGTINDPPFENPPG